MRVLYFHQHFTLPTKAGGTRSYELAQRLIARGHEVTMVCGQEAKLDLPLTKKKHIFRGDIDGIDVIQIAIPYSNNDGIATRAIGFVKFAWKGVRIALNEKYDLLFATSTPLTASIPGIAIKWFGRKEKFVFEVRDLWPELPKALGMKNPFLLFGMSVLEKWSYKNADACIGLSPGICDGIKRRSKDDQIVEMIPNGCDLQLFKPLSRHLLKLEGITNSDTVAIFTGAHGIANGLDAVLDMAAELKKMKRFDIKIVFIGSGKLKSSLEQRALNEGFDNCLFFDPVPKVKLKEIVACVDIGLMVLANIPAFYYGTSPNKFFDYISSGIPVVNNYPGWIADNINEAECGEVVTPENPIAFAKAIIKLADNKELCKKYGHNARQLAQEKYDRNLLGNKFVDFLENINKS